jgi:hypothetical protein
MSNRNNPDSYETEKERKRSLLRDKRVKHIEECDTCKAIMSRNKYNVNQGLCDNCIAAIN